MNVKAAELIKKMDELLLDHGKLKQFGEVGKLMRYVQGHAFNKIHIEGSVAASC